MRLKTVGRHLIAPLNARDKLFELSVLIGQFYQVTTYQTTVGDMLISENHSIVNNQGVPPAKYIRQVGRPKKRHIRSRGLEVVDRVRRPYQCGKCGSTNGHNRATFRLVEA